MAIRLSRGAGLSIGVLRESLLLSPCPAGSIWWPKLKDTTSI